MVPRGEDARDLRGLRRERAHRAVVVRVGTSGWSYPSWRPGFYPAGLDPSGFLSFYAGRFATVELNTTGYRLPAEDQFRRWAEQVPDEFEFAPKLPGGRLRSVDDFASRVRSLGDRLGPVRVKIESARDEGVLELLLGSLDPSLRLAFDLEHPSWDGIEPRLAEAGAVRVDDLVHPAPFRYLRRREPPDEGFAAAVAAAAEPVYVYFRHEQEPTAPAYAARLRELLDSG
ncbi:MAG: DUF72 domain-containing protein [Gaiellaceae bacterium]